MTLEYPQDGGSVCCCYDYHVETGLQDCVVCCVLHIIGCVMSDACHVKQEYLQGSGHGENADGLYSIEIVGLTQLFVSHGVVYSMFKQTIRKIPNGLVYASMLVKNSLIEMHFITMWRSIGEAPQWCRLSLTVCMHTGSKF